MEGNIVLKKIAKLVLSPRRDMVARDIKEIIKDLSHPSTSLEALKHIIHCSQNGQRFPEALEAVIGAATGDNIEIKELAVYYINNFAEVKKEQVDKMERAFLKNLSSCPPALKRSILVGIIHLLPYENIMFYLYDIKQACIDDNIPVRRSVPLCLGLIEKKHPGFISTNCLGSVLKRLVWDEEPSVQVAALDCLRRTALGILSVNELCEVITDCHHNGCPYALTAGLRLLETLDISAHASTVAPVVKSLVSSTDASVFYHASLFLYRLDPQSLQYIIDHACGFTSLRPEQLYNMLVFLKVFLSQIPPGSVEVKNGFITVYESDPPYILEAKLQVLCKIKSQEALEEIRRTLNSDKREIALEVCFRENVLIDDILNSHSAEEKPFILRCLSSTEIRLTSKKVSKFLESCGSSVENEEFLRAAGYHCKTMLPVITELDKKVHQAQLFYCHCGCLSQRLRELREEMAIKISGGEEGETLVRRVMLLEAYFLALSSLGPEEAFRKAFGIEEHAEGTSL